MQRQMPSAALWAPSALSQISPPTDEVTYAEPRVRSSASQDWMLPDAAAKEWSTPSPRSPLLQEITGARTREWISPPPVRRFPVGTLLTILLLLAGVSALGLAGVSALGYYVFGQNVIEWPSPPPHIPVDTTPPIIQSVSVSSITEASAVTTWVTDEPSTSQVMVCHPDGTCTWTQPDETPVTNHSVTLSNLEPDTTYHLTLISKDESGNEATSDRELTTLGQADTTPPLISEVNISNITETSATITWETDEDATSQVEYGITDAYGSSTSWDEELTTGHSITLSELEPDTTYHFRLKSIDASGNEAMSETGQIFETLPPVPVSPEVGSRAPNFTLYNLDGEEITLANLQGKIVMVNFWFASCAPCQQEMPYIQAVSDNWSDEELAILAINRIDSAGTIRSFMDSKGYTFPVLLDSVGAVHAYYDVSKWPTTFFIDAEGIIREVEVGRFHSQEEIGSILESL